MPSLPSAELAATLAAVATAIGVAVAVVQLRHNAKVNKAKFISSIVKEFFAKDDLRRLFYRIDYERFVFKEEEVSKFKGSEEERLLDELLYKYNHLSHLVRTRVVKLADVEFMMFEMVQVFKNEAVSGYLKWLDAEYARHGGYGGSLRRRPFDDARWLLECIRSQIGAL